MYLESKPSDSSRDISKSLYCECRVRGSFCERSEEYDVLHTARHLYILLREGYALLKCFSFAY